MDPGKGSAALEKVVSGFRCQVSGVGATQEAKVFRAERTSAKMPTTAIAARRHGLNNTDCAVALIRSPLNPSVYWMSCGSLLGL